MKKAIDFILSTINNKPFSKKINVYGWQDEYEHLLTSSVSNYLFEDFKVIENITPLTNENRPGNKKPKYYVTVHDTGDADPTHTALFWSETVKNEYWELGKYACSYQYVVGNDGVYHQIPDDEVAWHAGDTTKFDYKLYDSCVTGTNEHPIISISADGYYEIDGVKSFVLAPRIYKEKNGEVIIDRLATTSDINDQGILCKLVDGKYYIGETYFNSGYMLIANRGGNNNSIGIESCINKGTDIYYTWQKTAKLVANLLYNNNLTFDDIKQHHYFSGKDCPQTIRRNNMWEHFLTLVKCEYDAISFLKEGYRFKLISNSNNISSLGRVKAVESKKNEKVIIEVSKGDLKETLNVEINLPCEVK